MSSSNKCVKPPPDLILEASMRSLLN
jgi:hypothetical protein